MKETKENKKIKLLGKFMTKKVTLVVAIVCVIAIVILGIGSRFSTSRETEKLRFEDIGELATQCAYCTEINVIDEARELFKIKIPFTQSKYIYTMDFEIKAGFDFEEIKWDIKENKIVVSMPAVRVLSNEPRTDKVKIYHEKESIFKQIDLEDILVSIDDMKKDAEKNAIANGLYDNAKTNAETIITGFLAQEYDLEQYEVEYKYAEENTK